MSETEFSSNWQAMRFSDLVNLRRDSIHPGEATHLKYVGLEHIDSGATRLRRYGRPEEVKSAKNHFYPNDIIYGKLRPYLDKAVLAEEEGICSTDILVFQAKSDVTPEFISYLVHTHAFIRHAMSTTTGVNHPRTSWKGLSIFPVSLPPVGEQKAITAVLRTIQNAISARQQEAALERERKAALMQRLFTHGTRGEALKETPIGKIPESWRVKNLKECAYVQTGVAKGRRLKDAETITVPYLRVANVQDGYLDLSEIKKIRIRTDELERFLLQEGDVVVTEGGDLDKLGRGFIWRGQVPNCVHQNHVFAIRANPKMLLPEYLAYLVQSDYSKAYFLSVGHKTTNLATINSTKLKRLPVLVPEIDEQHTIVHILQACDRKITALEKEITILTELFQALLEQLMTGQLSARHLTHPIVRSNRFSGEGADG